MLLHTDPFTHRRFYTQTLLHTDPFTHRSFYTQKLLHTEAVDTQTPLHTDAFTHRSFYTQRLLHTDSFTHRRFYTQTLLHTDPFTHRPFYTQTLLQTETFTHRSFYTQTPLHTDQSCCGSWRAIPWLLLLQLCFAWDKKVTPSEPVSLCIVGLFLAMVEYRLIRGYMFCSDRSIATRVSLFRLSTLFDQNIHS